MKRLVVFGAVICLFAGIFFSVKYYKQWQDSKLGITENKFVVLLDSYTPYISEVNAKRFKATPGTRVVWFDDEVLYYEDVEVPKDSYEINEYLRYRISNGLTEQVLVHRRPIGSSSNAGVDEESKLWKFLEYLKNKLPYEVRERKEESYVKPVITHIVSVNVDLPNEKDPIGKFTDRLLKFTAFYNLERIIYNSLPNNTEEEISFHTDLLSVFYKIDPDKSDRLNIRYEFKER